MRYFRFSSRRFGFCSHLHRTVAGAVRCAVTFEQERDAVGEFSDGRLMVEENGVRGEPNSEELGRFLRAVEAERLKHMTRPKRRTSFSAL